MEIQRVRTEAPVVQLTAAFSAPADKVFAAWTDAAALGQWFMAGDGFSTTDVIVEARPLGRLNLVVNAPDDGGATHIRGHVVEVERDSILRCTWTGTAGDQLTLLVLRFAATADDGCELRLTHGVFEADDDREVHEQAWTTNLAALDRFLA